MNKLLILATALALTACAPPQLERAATVDTAHSVSPRNLPAFFDCLRERRQTLIAAHRGGPEPGYAENSLETFAHTLAQAPAILELDIARTRDDQLVLMHDDDVARTTNGDGAVSDLTLAQVQALSLQDDEGRTLQAHPPTLRQALEWAEGRSILELDVKRGVAYEDVIAAVRAAGAQNRVVVITYSTDAAIRVHRLAPELVLSVSINDPADLAALERAHVDLSRVLAWTGTDEPNAPLNAALAQRGVETIFGTLGNPERSWDGRFARQGADQYGAFAATGLQLIATDRPVAAVAALDAADGVDGYGVLQCVGAT